MKARRKRRTVHKLGRQVRRLEKRQNEVVRDVLHAVFHFIEEYAPAEPVPGSENRRGG